MAKEALLSFYLIQNAKNVFEMEKKLSQKPCSFTFEPFEHLNFVHE